MFSRLSSIRVKTLGIVLLTTIIGFGFTYIVVNGIENKIEMRQTSENLARTNRAVLKLIEGGSGRKELLAISEVNADESIVVTKNGTEIFNSPSKGTANVKRLTESMSQGPYSVVTSAPRPDTAAIAAELTAATAMIIFLAVFAALWILRTIERSVSAPISKAVTAALRVAGGDLTARIGDVGSEEFRSLAHAFDSMAAKLEDHENEQKKFLGDLSHEIATPINAVSGFALAICDRTIKGQEKLSEAAWLIQEETDRINHLLADLRTLDRLDIAHTVTKEAFYLDLYLKELVLRFSSASGAKRLSVTWEAPHLELYLDRRLLDMVISNFTSNSIRYVNPTGKVHISAREVGGELIFAVRDNGIGIAPVHLNRIFDRLYRVDEARDRVSGGSGLGLAIARRAAQSLGGRIEVESQSGKGSEFRLLIPSADVVVKNSKADSRRKWHGEKAPTNHGT